MATNSKVVQISIEFVGRPVAAAFVRKRKDTLLLGRNHMVNFYKITTSSYNRLYRVSVEHPKVEQVLGTVSWLRFGNNE